MYHLWYSDIYTDGLDPESTFPRERYREVHARLMGCNQVTFHVPTPLAVEDIKLIPTETVAQVQLVDQVVVEVEELSEWYVLFVW